MNNNDYIKLSLELHLFFDRIMKEHSLFLKAAFTERDKDFKKIAKEFEKSFSKILKDIIKIADGNVNREFLNSLEIVTKDTIKAENKTNVLLGDNIDTNITLEEMNLKSGNIKTNSELLNKIQNINKQTLVIVKNLIHFKNEVLNKVLACEMYTFNYPLLIEHIMNEAKMYHKLLEKLENKDNITYKDIYEQEVFWNNIMKEHALFIRGLLDPSEDKLILTADRFAVRYKDLPQRYNGNLKYLTDASLNETINFRDFKIAGSEGILNCKIKSVIIPLLADHVVREANHFIRILKSVSNN